jgi:hypothetical protein
MIAVNQVDDKNDFNLKEYNSVNARKSYQCNSMQFSFDSSKLLKIYFKFLAWLKNTSSDFDEIIRICNIYYNKDDDIDTSSLRLYNSLVLEYNPLTTVNKCSKKRKINVCIYIFIYFLLILIIIILIIGC